MFSMLEFFANVCEEVTNLENLLLLGCFTLLLPLFIAPNHLIPVSSTCPRRQSTNNDPILDVISENRKKIFRTCLMLEFSAQHPRTNLN